MDKRGKGSGLYNFLGQVFLCLCLSFLIYKEGLDGIDVFGFCTLYCYTVECEKLEVPYRASGILLHRTSGSRVPVKCSCSKGQFRPIRNMESKQQEEEI